MAFLKSYKVSEANDVWPLVDHLVYVGAVDINIHRTKKGEIVRDKMPSWRQWDIIAGFEEGFEEEVE